MSTKSFLLTLTALAAIVVAAYLLVAASGCASQETTVTMNDLPPAVRATLEKEIAGGKISEIEKETKGGKVVYSADAKIDGKEYEIAIAEDGKLISKEIEK